jgi:hypothetical protein
LPFKWDLKRKKQSSNQRKKEHIFVQFDFKTCTNGFCNLRFWKNMAMNSKNHCDDLGQKSRFCYLDRTKKAKNDYFSSFFKKVQVSRKVDFEKICQQDCDIAIFLFFAAKQIFIFSST